MAMSLGMNHPCKSLDGLWESCFRKGMTGHFGNDGIFRATECKVSAKLIKFPLDIHMCTRRSSRGARMCASSALAHTHAIRI